MPRGGLASVGEGGVEVAQVGRPQDDLRDAARVRAVASSVIDAAQPIDGRSGDPAAAPVELDDHVARAAVRALDLGRDQLVGRGRREALERGQHRPAAAAG